jgi:putative (di)nucleoside polyphosphate hydrolase
VIDSEGYRLNVGIILCNEHGRLFWARRVGQRSWQFPQGGIQRDESPEEAMFRELAEEIGLRPEHVQVIGCTRGWLRYRLPKHLVRQGNKQSCIGQKQVWFLLRMLGDEEEVRLDLSDHPEFDYWQWVDYWYPLRAVVWFKRQVYWQALRELAPLLFAGRSSRLAATARATRSAQRGEEGSMRRDPSSSGRMRYPAHSARVTEPIAPVATPQRPLIVPLRRVDTCHHPVITRMVVSTRRFGVSDSSLIGPGLEQAGTAALEESCIVRSTASGPRHWSRR